MGRQMADERLHGDFLGKFQGVDFSAQRALLAKGRTADNDSNRACRQGDPLEKGGIKTIDQYQKEQAAKRKLEEESAEAELEKDPEYRRQAAARRAEEEKERDKAAFAKDEEERIKRLEMKKRQLASGDQKAAAGKSVKKSRMSFDADEEDEDDSGED